MDTADIKGKLNLFFTSYKTTICGIAIGALNLYASGQRPKDIALSVAIAVLGIVSKDADVTMSVSGTLPKRIPGDVVEAAKAIEDEIKKTSEARNG